MPLPGSGYVVSDCLYTVSVAGVVTHTLRASFDQNQSDAMDIIMTDAIYALADFFAAEFPENQVTVEKMYAGSRPESLQYPRP